jgi:hypothetical protein
MLPVRRRTACPSVCLLALLLAASACEKVPLLAPTGSTITLTASTNALSVNGALVVTAQVLEAAGTPPHSGTHVTFTTTIGRMEPAEVTTDAGGRATATFFAGGINGTATITAVSGGATTGTNGALKIAVGTAAVQKVVVNASPGAVSAINGTSTITAFVLDINGNALVGSPVLFTTTAGTLSTSVATTSEAGVATTVLTTGQEATVTASVGVQSSSSTSGSGSGSGSSGSGSTTASGQASGSVTVKVLNGPSILIDPATTPITRGLPALFTITVTPAQTNGSPIRDVVINWGDGDVRSYGALTGAQKQTHTYTSNGTFIITVTVTDATGQTYPPQSASVAVVSPARPGISITPSPTTAATGASIQFTVTITAASGITIRSATIDYGDGNAEELGGVASATRFHSYATAGTKIVTVSVLDAAGQTTTTQISVVITP